MLQMQIRVVGRLVVLHMPLNALVMPLLLVNVAISQSLAFYMM